MPWCKKCGQTIMGRCDCQDTPKPESLTNTQLKESELELKPQAAADSFEVNHEDLDQIVELLKGYPTAIKYVQDLAQGVARMQELRIIDIDNLNEFYRDRISALQRENEQLKARLNYEDGPSAREELKQQVEYTVKVERERDELKCKLDESLELISQMRAQWFGSWAMNKCISMLRGTRFKHPEHEDPFWLQRIGGGK